MLSIVGLSFASFSSSRAVSAKLLQRALHISKIRMSLKAGDKIPSVDLFESNPTNKVNISQLCQGQKVVVFGVPGAFTPGCSKTHLPGYVERASEIKKNGIGEIVCVSVNDPFVMDAWGKEHKVEGKVRMLADPTAAFTKAMKLQTELPPLGGTRSKRYSMVIEDGVIKSINVEPDGTGLTCSLADKLPF